MSPNRAKRTNARAYPLSGVDRTRNRVGTTSGNDPELTLQAGERPLKCPILLLPRNWRSGQPRRYAPQILGNATCTRLRHRGCIRCNWCYRELGAADRMGGRCRDCRAAVRRAGLAMATFAGVGPRGDAGRRGTSILAAGGWSNCRLRHASAKDWTELRPSAGRLCGGRSGDSGALSGWAKFVRTRALVPPHEIANAAIKQLGPP
jgi:hypothetical protein